MSLAFTDWDDAIAARLQPIRDELASVPVAALPREAGKFGVDNFESVDWLFPSYSPIPSNNQDGVQDVNVNLTVRLYFQYLYSIGIETNTLRWAESQILSLLVSYRLPQSYGSIQLLPCRLYAPEQGQWHKEINFEFRARIVPSDTIEAPPAVEVIGIDNQSDELIRVE